MILKSTQHFAKTINEILFSIFLLYTKYIYYSMFENAYLLIRYIQLVELLTIPKHYTEIFYTKSKFVNSAKTSPFFQNLNNTWSAQELQSS